MAWTWTCQPSRSSARDEAVQHRLRVDRRAGVAFAIEVGREQRRGTRLDHAVLEELRRERPHPRRRVAGPPVAQPPDHARDPVESGSPSAAATTRSVSRFSRCPPRRRRGGSAPRPRASMTAVMAPLGREPERAVQSRRQLGVGPLRQQTRHQVHRRLAQGAAGLARFADPARCARRGIRRVASDPGELQCPAVGPGGVAVRRLDVRRPVGRDPVEQRFEGLAFGNAGSSQPTPRSHAVGSGGGAGGDRVGHLARGLEVKSVHSAELHAALARVHVPVLEAGEQHPVRRGPPLRSPRRSVPGQAVPTDVGDPPAAHRHRAGPASGRVDGVDGAVAEDEVRRLGRSVPSRSSVAARQGGRGARSPRQRQERAWPGSRVRLANPPGPAVRTRSWKSKLKSTAGEPGTIAQPLDACRRGRAQKVANASARSSRSRQRARKVSCCQWTRSPTSDGVRVKRITSPCRSCVDRHVAIPGIAVGAGVARQRQRGSRGRVAGGRRPSAPSRAPGRVPAAPAARRRAG